MSRDTFRLAADLAALHARAAVRSTGRPFHLEQAAAARLLKTSRLRNELRRLNNLIDLQPALPKEALPYLEHARARCAAQLQRLDAAWLDWANRLAIRQRAKRAA